MLAWKRFLYRSVVFLVQIVTLCMRVSTAYAKTVMVSQLYTKQAGSFE